MLCILKIAEPSCQIRFSLKLRKHCLAQSNTCLHQSSFDKPVQNYPVQRLSKSDKTKVIPKHVYNFYLPLGSKRNSFVNREDKSTNVIRNNICILNALNKSENGGNKFEKKALFSHELLSSKEDRLSKRENILLCNSQEDARSKISKKDDKDPKANLELISDRLTQDLTNIFMKRQNWSIYRKDLVFQDTSRGIKIVGLQKYQLYINLLRMLAHMRFVYVRMTLLSVSKDEDESCVEIRWSIVGLGFLKFCIRYFPDKLWEKNSMERLSPSYLDGYSIFYVDGNNKIYRHNLHSIMSDKDKEEIKSPVQKIIDLIGKQQRVTQPAFMK